MAISHSLYVSLKQLEARKRAIELVLLQHPDDKKAKERLEQTNKSIEEVKKTLKEGFGKKPKWR